MATAPRTAKIDSSLTVTWATPSGTLFDGWMLIGIVPPSVTGADAVATNAPYIAYGNQIALEKIPTFYVIPIVEGKFDQNCRVLFTSDLQPPRCRYVAWLYDRTWRMIDAPGAPSPPLFPDAFEVTTDPFTPPYSMTGPQAVPGLTAPSPD